MKRRHFWCFGHAIVVGSVIVASGGCGAEKGSTGSGTGGGASASSGSGGATGPASSSSGGGVGGNGGAPGTASSSTSSSTSSAGSSSTSSSSSSSSGTPQDDGGVPVDPTLLAKCSGTNPIACHFGGNPGNYDVTVEIGGAKAADTSLMAEFSREMLPAATTSANETLHFTTTVNVRHPEGQPVADLGNPASGLDLYFWGNNNVLPALTGVGFAPATAPIVVYLATDSTGCDQWDTAYAGWGQWLPQYFTSPISIANYGNSGVDTPGFQGGSAYWGAIEPLLTSKDFLLIELGDNDKSDTEAVISDALTVMIKGAKAKGATPLLMTPVQRAIFTGNNVNGYITNSTGANVPTIMKQVGQAQNVTVLDLTTRTTAWLQQLGPNGWHPYFAMSAANKWDYTHLNQAGASIVAGFIRDLMKEAGVPVLTNYFR